jgi:hypothetical protein
MRETTTKRHDIASHFAWRQAQPMWEPIVHPITHTHTCQSEERVESRTFIALIVLGHGTALLKPLASDEITSGLQRFDGIYSDQR